MAPRANWKGFIKISELAFPVALYAAATTSERISFHTINRKTGNRVRRQFVDEETERPVEREAQVKGYEISKDHYVVLEQDEINETVPESDKTIRIEAFIPNPEIDTVYFDRPYFLTPSGAIGNEAFTVLREGMKHKKVAALARAVLFRRVRTLLLRAEGPGLIADTLNFDYEVRPADKAFDDIPQLKIQGEMLDLAKHIIDTKSGQVRSARIRRPLRGGPGGHGEGQDRRTRIQGAEAAEGNQGRRPHGRASQERRSVRKTGAESEAQDGQAPQDRPKVGAGPAPQGKLMALTAYRKKRDFGTTPEPRGSAKKARGGDSYVIQKHDARRLHYDLRLEMDGVLKSWAVTKGPSLVPGEKRLAVHVEDHPLEYGGFEGTIPKGEYGGGTVIVWDRGRWSPIGDAKKGYAKGHLDFELHGEKLRGRWHLVRMAKKPREKRENWLLIKGDDEEARDEDAPDILEERPESVKTGRLVKDVEGEAPGWSSKTGQIDPPPAPKPPKRAKKTAFPGFIEPALATLKSVPPPGANWIHEIKFDGYRLQAQLRSGKVKLLTRSGLDWTAKFGKAVTAAIAALPVEDAIIDGEVVVEGAGHALRFLGIAGRPLRRSRRSSCVLRLRPALSRRPRPAPRTTDRAQGRAAGPARRARPRRSATATISRRMVNWSCAMPAG